MEVQRGEDAPKLHPEVEEDDKVHPEAEGGWRGASIFSDNSNGKYSRTFSPGVKPCLDCLRDLRSSASCRHYARPKSTKIAQLLIGLPTPNQLSCDSHPSFKGTIHPLSPYIKVFYNTVVSTVGNIVEACTLTRHLSRRICLMGFAMLLPSSKNRPSRRSCLR